MESRVSKGKRVVLFSTLVFLVALIAPAAAAGAAQFTSGLQTHTTVLSTDNVVSYAWGLHVKTTDNYSALTLATASGNTTVTNTYSYQTTNATGVVTTHTVEPTTDYLLTNMTIGEMNLHSVSKYNISTSIAVNTTAILGYGSSYSNFVPIATSAFTAAKNKTADFGYAISPAYLTGNQSMYLMIELEMSNKSTPASYTIGLHANGVASGLFGYQTGEDVGYVIGGISILVFAFLSMPYYDLQVRQSKMGAMTVPKTGKKKGGR